MVDAAVEVAAVRAEDREVPLEDVRLHRLGVEVGGVVLSHLAHLLEDALDRGVALVVPRGPRGRAGAGAGARGRVVGGARRRHPDDERIGARPGRRRASERVQTREDRPLPGDDQDSWLNSRHASRGAAARPGERRPADAAETCAGPRRRPRRRPRRNVGENVRVVVPSRPLFERRARCSATGRTRATGSGTGRTPRTPTATAVRRSGAAAGGVRAGAGAAARATRAIEVGTIGAAGAGAGALAGALAGAGARGGVVGPEPSREPSPEPEPSREPSRRAPLALGPAAAPPRR